MRLLLAWRDSISERFADIIHVSPLDCEPFQSHMTLGSEYGRDFVRRHSVRATFCYSYPLAVGIPFSLVLPLRRNRHRPVTGRRYVVGACPANQPVRQLERPAHISMDANTCDTPLDMREVTTKSRTLTDTFLGAHKGSVIPILKGRACILVSPSARTLQLPLLFTCTRSSKERSCSPWNVLRQRTSLCIVAVHWPLLRYLATAGVKPSYLRLPSGRNNEPQGSNTYVDPMSYPPRNYQTAVVRQFSASRGTSTRLLQSILEPTYATSFPLPHLLRPKRCLFPLRRGVVKYGDSRPVSVTRAWSRIRMQFRPLVTRSTLVPTSFSCSCPSAFHSPFSLPLGVLILSLEWTSRSVKRQSTSSNLGSMRGLEIRDKSPGVEPILASDYEARSLPSCWLLVHPAVLSRQQLVFHCLVSFRLSVAVAGPWIPLDECYGGSRL